MSKKSYLKKKALNVASKWLSSIMIALTVFSGFSPTAALAHDGYSNDHDVFITNPDTLVPTENSDGTWTLNLEGVVGGEGTGLNKFIRVSWGDGSSSESKIPPIRLKQIRDENGDVINAILDYQIVGNPDAVTYLPSGGFVEKYGTRLSGAQWPDVNGDWMARHNYAGSAACVTLGSCALVVEVRQCEISPAGNPVFCAGDSTFLDSHSINVTFPVEPPPPAPEGTLEIIKRVVNTVDKDALSSDDVSFVLTHNGATSSVGFDSSFSLILDLDNTVTVRPLVSGSYSVVENPIPNYTVSYSEGCSGTIANGNTLVCTVTNTHVGHATLTIEKEWVYLDSEVTPEVSAEIFLNEESVLTSNGDNDSVTLENLAPGEYVITEGEVPGFTTSIACVDDYGEGQEGIVEVDSEGEIYLENGDDVTCTVTNTEEEDDDTGTLIVVKNVINDGEGTFQANEFLLTVTTEVGEEETQHTFRGDAGGTSLTLPAGVSYAVSESAFQAFLNAFNVLGPSENLHGYSVSFSEGCTGVITEGETVTCTVTNNDQGSGNGGNGGGGGDTGGGNATNPASAGSSFGGGSVLGITDTSPQVLGVQDTDETILTCSEQYPDAALITGALDELLAAYGFTRNTGLEQTLAQTVLPKILPTGILLTQEQILRNFVVYGVQSLLHLGAGERAGVVASFNLLYGHMPQNECDWQNVIRIGQGVVPVVLSPEREATVEAVFAEIYDRAPNRADNADNVTVLIMSYGLRPDVRSIRAEVQAGSIFRAIFGHAPRTTHEWDVMRGIAYGGLTVPGFSPITR